MNKSLELFYLFLEANGALIAWEQNFLKDQAGRGEPQSRADFFRTQLSMEHRTCGGAFIAGAFRWNSTPQGPEYWCQLDNKWHMHLSQSI
jgi:hypothetical protein